MKLLGNDGPDLRLEAAVPRKKPVIVGDTVKDGTAQMTATVVNVPPGSTGVTLHLVRNGVAIETVPVVPPALTHHFVADGPGRYRLELQRDGLAWALTTPIWVVE